MAWYGVRCIFELQKGMYEERITIWSCNSAEQAVELAEEDAREYVENIEILGYVGIAQAYLISDDTLAHGSEVFSLIRYSALSPQAYVSTFFDTGAEHQAQLGSDTVDISQADKSNNTSWGGDQ